MIQIIFLLFLLMIIYFIPSKIFIQVDIQFLLLLPFLLFKNYFSILYLFFYSLKMINYELKEKYSSELVPKQIFQTWHTKEVPPHMAECMERNKKLYPDFKFILFDDNECREYLIKNFPKEYIDTFDKLKPGSYKADLWRLCVLYKEGGIYMDAKITLMETSNLNELIKDEHVVEDVPAYFKDSLGVYNAFMIFKPRNPYVKKCMDKIIENVKNNYYGECPLDVTGPRMMGKIYLQNKDIAPKLIIDRYPIFGDYDKYREECLTHRKTKKYSDLWSERDIYN